jgi:hypothetical protein
LPQRRIGATHARLEYFFAEHYEGREDLVGLVVDLRRGGVGVVKGELGP